MTATVQSIADVIMDPWVLTWAVSLLTAQIIFQIILGFISSPFRAKPGAAAHQIVALVPFCYAAYHGVALWLFDADIASMHVGSATDRLYGQQEGAWMLIRFMLGFQVYDLLATGLEASLRKLEHLAHHTATLLTALSAASSGGPFFCYYAVFFFGFTELSSVPLAFVDLFRQFPTLAKQFPATNELNRTVFSVSFLVIRVLWFPYVMITKWWPDLIEAWSTPSGIRCSMPAYCWMFFSSVFLTFLQLFWGYKILRVVLKGNLGGNNAVATKHEAD